MGGIFNMDGPFFRFGNAIADIMILSFIWILFSIPLFTIGASTTALFYVTTRRISDREGYLFKDFYTSFKANFKMATLLWMVWVALFGVVAINIYMLMFLEFEPLLANILLPIQICLMIELYITSIYMFPLVARFDMGFRQTIKSAFFMANRHILTTLSCVATGVAIMALAVMLFEPILLVSMGMYAYIISYMIMNIFKKYRPEIDAEQWALQELAPLPDDIFGDKKEEKEPPID